MYTHKVFMVQLFQHWVVLVEQKTVGANQLPGAKRGRSCRASLAAIKAGSRCRKSSVPSLHSVILLKCPGLQVIRRQSKDRWAFFSLWMDVETAFKFVRLSQRCLYIFPNQTELLPSQPRRLEIKGLKWKEPEDSQSKQTAAAILLLLRAARRETESTLPAANCNLLIVIGLRLWAPSERGGASEEREKTQQWKFVFRNSAWGDIMKL